MPIIDRIDDWTAAIDNRAAVPGHEEIFLDWGRRAAAFREECPPETRPYGDDPREAFDLWLPEGKPRGLLIFIHGGWWMHFSKDYFSDIAAGPLARGWAVAIPSYTLLPGISLTGLVDQTRGAVETIARTIPGIPLVIAGHSAGGHLAAMMGTDAGPDPATHARLIRIVAISGVHDLRPLRGLPINETLGITATETGTLSPALLNPRPGFDLIAWSGADELPEFRRQTAFLAVAWGGYTSTIHVEAAGLDHFTAFAPLANPDSELSRLALS